MRMQTARSTYHDPEYEKPDGEFGRDWHVFDDDVCIDDNVQVFDTTFRLSHLPVGIVRILLVNG